MNKDFEFIVKMFLELRQKGSSLSASDLDILEKWENTLIQPDFIYQVMNEMYQESTNKKKSFPKQLSLIDKRIDKIISKMKDT